MKPVLFSLLILLEVGNAVGEDAVAPQARRRLDPASNRVVVLPAPAAMVAPDSGGSTTLMDRYLVTAPGLMYLLRRPQTPADPKGKFTWRDGGSVAAKNIGALRVEVGLWTHVDILADDNAFLGYQAKQNFDLLRIKW
jgi:hypothetical protein